MFNSAQKLMLAGLLMTAPLSSYAVTCAKENEAVSATTDHLQVSSIAPDEIYDDKTNLTWKRCSVGQEWSESNSSCEGAISAMNWPEALAATAAAGAGWRLPNIKELHSIVEQRCYSPSVDSAIFPATSSSWYWSSSTFVILYDKVWGVDFGVGDGAGEHVNTTNKSDDRSVRLVRSGQ